MSELASPAQLRGAFLRWALFLVPGIVLLGLLAYRLSGAVESAWFRGLEKPGIYPAAFPVVWVSLYVLMGVASAIIVAARGARGRNQALVVFAGQLVLSLAWYPVFVGFHQITGALLVILLLGVAVISTIAQFWKIRPVAAWLLLPYLLWIAFATVLTWEFLVANPRADGRAVSGAVTRMEI